MLHGPCGEDNPNASCMQDAKCSKEFPKAFQESTAKNVKGYPFYRRRSGPYVRIRNNYFDNRSVVPYNKFLTLKYDCHINVEACTSLAAVKYIYKYIYKGYDCARIVVGQGNNEQLIVDEISRYIDTRYISAPEAMWRLLKYKMHDRSHVVIRLGVHLDQEQQIIFQAGHEQEALLAAQTGVTTLTDWFRLNREDVNARGLLYPDLPYHYVFRKGTWKRRERQTKLVPRMYTVSIRDEERFYLRMLLLHVRGATSYADIRTVDDVVYNTFKEAAFHRHLLASDEEWRNCLAESATFHMPQQMRQCFAFICIFGELTNALALWEEFREDFILDFRRNFCDEPSCINLALLDLQFIFRQHGVTCSTYQLPTPDENVSNVQTLNHQLQQREADRLIATLNREQKNAFDLIEKGVKLFSKTVLFEWSWWFGKNVSIQHTDYASRKC